MTTKTIRTAARAKAAATPSNTPAKTNAKPSTKPNTAVKVSTIAAKSVKPEPPAKSAGKHRGMMPSVALPSAATGQNKQARLIALLRSPKGGTIEQMTALTGWQAHTVRGTISGVLRKRLGLSVACAASSEDGTRIYRIVEAVAA